MKWQSYKENLLHAIKRFFYGRNGVDHLSLAILIISFLISIVAQAAGLPWLLPVYYAGVFLCFYRVLSKNIRKRQGENYWFLSKTRAVSTGFRLRHKMLQERGIYKYLKCPDCKQRLRVPRGKGKIEITCAKCGTRIVKKV